MTREKAMNGRGMTIDKAILRVEHSQMEVDDKETADFIIDTMRNFDRYRKILSEIEYEMECTMESDPRTMHDPYHEYGWLFSRINEWRKKLREILDRD